MNTNARRKIIKNFLVMGNCFIEARDLAPDEIEEMKEGFDPEYIELLVTMANRYGLEVDDVSPEDCEMIITYTVAQVVKQQLQKYGW